MLVHFNKSTKVNIFRLVTRLPHVYSIYWCDTMDIGRFIEHATKGVTGQNFPQSMKVALILAKGADPGEMPRFVAF